ncbi:hypothetical protein H2248_001313 [Termitomyces sp. 'cryptogamus']|nr:hypothetical protein H2248_001313 [Termitomyces sp. 'cryptogamus']
MFNFSHDRGARIEFTQSSLKALEAFLTQIIGQISSQLQPFAKFQFGPNFDLFIPYGIIRFRVPTAITPIHTKWHFMILKHSLLFPLSVYVVTRTRPLRFRFRRYRFSNGRALSHTQREGEACCIQPNACFIAFCSLSVSSISIHGQYGI